ncbi:hypothetical protein P7C71_g3228, partial [Lecanoromycetidae sp. Uapishka_2]
MGQRHQLFVIARINGKYRTLAAVHHQWLYGRTALRRCHGTLKLLQHPGSQLPLQQELIAAARHEEAFWGSLPDKEDDEHVTDIDKSDEHVPFPYIMTCLMLGASFGPSDGHISNVLVEPFHMKYNEGDNNNGITIFDVTDTCRVRYCFVDFYGMESKREVQLMAPLSARTYLAAYYELSDPKHQDDLVPLVEDFKAWSLIPTETLEDAWPGEGWEEPVDEKDNEATTEDSLGLEALHIDSEGDKTSLRARAMDAVVQSLLDDPDSELPVLSEAELLSDFLPKLKSKLYKEADSLEPTPGLIELMFEAFKHDVQVDLNLFQIFTPKDLFALTSKLTRHGKLAVLNLSNMPKLVDDDLQTLLGANITIQSLCLIDCPQISIDGLMSLNRSYDLYHSGLYKRAIVDNRQTLEGYRYEQMPLPRLNFSCQNADSINQLVWIGFDTFQAKNPAFRGPDGAMAWEKMTSDNIVPTYMSGRREQALQYKKFQLVDTPLPLARLVTGISHLLKWGSIARPMGTYEVSTAFASCFAMPASIPGGPKLAVAPLSTELYLRNSGDGNSLRRDIAQEEPALRQGEWAIILVHECFDAYDQESLDKETSPEDKSRLLKRLRYALVSPSGDGFTVADVHHYIGHITTQASSKEAISAAEKKSRQTFCHQLRQWWDDNFKPSESMGFYAEDDIHDILKRVYLCAAEDKVAPEPERVSQVDMAVDDIMGMITKMQRGDA